MTWVLISFILVFFIEWKYLKIKNRKKRTYWIVFMIMGVCFLYCLTTVVFEHFPSPNDLIRVLFHPLPQKIVG